MESLESVSLSGPGLHHLAALDGEGHLDANVGRLCHELVAVLADVEGVLLAKWSFDFARSADLDLMGERFRLARNKILRVLQIYE